MKDRKIKVEQLARVEGEGSLFVSVKKGIVGDVKLGIFEPPRFFEAFLRGRKYDEAIDITARICGICPVAYQMSAAHAMESAMGVQIDDRIRALRRLLYCGEWIESHALHVLMLHAEDFLGYADVLEMAKDHPDIVRNGLRMKKYGNEIVTLLGGREIHPVSVRTGGFYRVPDKEELVPLREKLERGRETAVEITRWVADFRFPDFEDDYMFVSLRGPGEYPFCEGRLVSNKGLDIGIEEFGAHFSEEHVQHSNALHSWTKGNGAYFTGPLARYNLNYDNLSQVVKEMAEEVGLGSQCRNPFKSIIVRCVEIVYAFDEAIRIIEGYEKPEEAAVEFEPKGGVGHGCTEAPRGILYHRYELDSEGVILNARIVPPTAQNQKIIEQDLKRYVSHNLDLPEEELTWQCEQVIRNYDPCISCATHFLTLHIDGD